MSEIRCIINANKCLNEIKCRHSEHGEEMFYATKLSISIASDWADNEPS